MNRIKTFSDISESASDSRVYRTKIATYPGQNIPTTIDIYNEPKDLHNVNVSEGVVEWTLDLRQREWGIELGSDEASIKSMSMTLVLDDEMTGETQEDTIELTEKDFEFDAITTEIHNFPLHLESIEIDMKNSHDTHLWKITLHIGSISRY